MERRDFLKWSVGGLLTGRLWTPTEGAAAPRALSPKPNIVFIFADDWGWGDLSCRGHPWLKTPHLDRLASEGIDFQQFNVLNPVCSPSRTAVTTGLYPARFSIHQHFAPGVNVERGMPDWLDPKAPTLAHFLQNAGYRTGHFGKWHLTNTGAAGAPLPSAYGFDEFAVFNGPGGVRDQAGLHDTARNAVRFMRASKGRPFYVNVWLHESHTPHVPTKESIEKWKHLDEQKQVYAAVITDGDNDVGHILAALKETGVEDSTIVIFSSDNGPEWTSTRRQIAEDVTVGARGYDTYYSVGDTGGLRGRKRSLFEGGVRTPFIVRWPGHTPAGAKNEKTVVTAVDLLPTLCAAADLKLPDDYHGDGENLLAAFNGRGVLRTRPIFWEWRGNKTEPDWWPRLAVREGDWKLAMTYDASRVELHQLVDDRAEAKDVAKENPEIVARLSRLALDWKSSLPEKPNPDCISQSTTTPATRATKGKPAPQTGKAGAKPDRGKIFDGWDTNKDGRLSLEEYRAGLKNPPDTETRFQRFDRNGDGMLGREEFVNPSGK
jgi:N-acetylgalactosamine-6-sulfatase